MDEGLKQFLAWYPAAQALSEDQQREFVRYLRKKEKDEAQRHLANLRLLREMFHGSMVARRSYHEE